MGGNEVMTKGAREGISDSRLFPTFLGRQIALDRCLNCDTREGGVSDHRCSASERGSTIASEAFRKYLITNC